jgi:hypothetical protein
VLREAAPHLVEHFVSTFLDSSDLTATDDPACLLISIGLRYGTQVQLPRYLILGEDLRVL